MAFNDIENLELLRATTGGLPYKAPSYTCIQKFTDNFPKKKPTEFVQQHFPAAESAWQPETPYPRFYTKNYRKTILSVLK